MLLLLFCVCLQGMLLYERILNKMLFVFFASGRSMVRRQADNMVISNLFAQILTLLSMPLQLAVVVVRTILGNLILCAMLMVFVGVVVTLSESSTSIITVYVNTYNEGVGALVDAIVVKPLQVLDFLFRCVVPLYNAALWLLTQLFARVFLPFTNVHVESIPALVGDFGLLTQTLAVSWATCMRRALECGNNMKVSEMALAEPATVRPFTPPDLQCVANSNYITLDLMTPGIYCSKVANHLLNMFTASCTWMSSPLSIIMYPLLDFNLYKGIHCAANLVVHVVVALPLITNLRCQYAKKIVNQFTELEKTVMCAPDWSPAFLIFNSMMRSVGTLVDNWVNIMLVVVEKSSGIATVQCDSVLSVGDVWLAASDVFEESRHHLKVVGLSSVMYAVTDGTSSAYHTMTDGGSTAWSVSTFPFRVDTTLGVAAVRYGEVYDADSSGDTRTGMLGCECVDRTEANGQRALSVRCSSVPYFANFYDSDDEYARHTTQEVVFSSDTATYGMTCATTIIKVMSLRFSRKRFSTSHKSGVDTSFDDAFNAFGSSGAQEVKSFAADAMIYIQPMCGADMLPCLPESQNCYPYCMGLHVGGRTNQNIRMQNARDMDQYVTLMSQSCLTNGANTQPLGQMCSDPGFTAAREADTLVSGIFQSVCSVNVDECVRHDTHDTIMHIDNIPSPDPSSALAFRRDDEGLTAAVRLRTQPFVVAGDVLLHQRMPSDASAAATDSGHVVVSRLYDNNRGSYSLQQEQLGMLSNRQTVPLVVCEVEASATCYTNALYRNAIVMPRTYMASNEFQSLAVSSEWAVHWAVNPVNSIFEEILDYCQNSHSSMTVLALSSYSKPRVWSLTTSRAAQMLPTDVVDDERQHSYMVVPDWVQWDIADVPCTQQFNFQIVDLEYINENNILITTLYTTMRDYRLDGSVCDGCAFEYRRYFLNPNRHDCIEPDESDDAMFSCWKREDSGMFEDMQVTETQAFGVLCPALKRMPYFGSMYTESILAASSTFRVVLEIATVLIVVLASDKDVQLADLFAVRIARPTFHHLLDSGGSTLFDFESTISSLDRCALYASDMIVKSGRVFAGGPGYATLQPVFIGTAKIFQHSAGTVPLRGPLLRQVRKISKMGKQQFNTLKEVSWIETGRKMPSVVTATMAWVYQQMSALKLTLQLMRTVTVKSLKAAARKQMSVVYTRARKKAIEKGKVTLKNTAKKRALVFTLLETQQLLSAVLYETTSDVERSFLDNIRVICDGLGQVFGTDNSFAGTLKHACLLVPDTLQSTMTFLNVLLVDYPTMACVCNVPEQQQTVEVVTQVCLLNEMPNTWRAWIFNAQLRPANEVLSLCHTTMDVANNKLITAYDPVSSRLYKMTTAMRGLFDLLSVMLQMDTGTCTDYARSPFVVSIMPEPADYFMPCMHTEDCRIRCLDTYTAFDAALARLDVKPTFSKTIAVDIESKFFSSDDIENNRHLPPFDIIGISELPFHVCAAEICSRDGAHPQNRCLAAVGVHVARYELGLAYYCLPADITQYVYRYDKAGGPKFVDVSWPVDETVQEGFLLTLDETLQGSLDSMLVVTVDSITLHKSLHIFSHHSDMFTVLQSEEFDRQSYSTTRNFNSPAFVLNSITKVRVLPANALREDEGRRFATVFVLGTKVYINQDPMDGGGYIESQEIQQMCIEKRIFFASDPSLPAFTVQTLSCMGREGDIFTDTHTEICVSSDCTDVVSMPLTVAKDTFISRYTMDPVTMERSQETSYHSMSPSSRTLSQLVGFDAANPLYITQGQQAVVNKKHVSSMARLATDGGDSLVDILVSGTIASHRSWIQSVRVRLDPTKKAYGAAMHLSSKVRQTVDIKLQCRIDNCIGCQTAAPGDHRFIDVQSKCFAAARCGVRKCVGTQVNIRKPLCNIGSVLAEMVEGMRVILHAVWQLLAKAIIGVVELSHERRERYKFEYPEHGSMATYCIAKDTIVQTVSMFTSSIGGVVYIASIIDKEVISDGVRSNFMDTRFFARFYMSTVALTNFIASFFMMPIYLAMGLEKTLSCGVNDVIGLVDTIITGASGGVVQLGSRQEFDTKNERAVAVCAAQSMAQRMRDLGMDDAYSGVADVILTLIDQASNTVLAGVLQIYMNEVDAFLTWLIGIVSTFMDWLQTIDWKHCSMPVVANTMVYKCVCGDQAHTVVATRRAQSIADGAFWCTGPLLMLDLNGDDKLIWNSYPLATLAGSDYEDYFECIKKSVSCEKHLPRFDDLSRQGVNPLQVITRCRDNYNQKRWDTGVLTLGLFTPAQWLRPDTLSNSSAWADNDEHLRKTRMYLGVIGPSLISPLVLDAQLYACLEKAITSGSFTLQEVCMRQWLGMHEDEYFAYTAATALSFAATDACAAYTGNVSAFSDNAVARSGLLWSANSNNHVPLTERHVIQGIVQDNRVQVAEATLQQYLTDVIHPQLHAWKDIELSSHIRTSLWSVEGDEIHQLVDCFILGPYASADLHSSFDVSGGGGKFPVPQYHRGNVNSREFAGRELGTTYGSEPRQKIVGAVVEALSTSATDAVTAAAINVFAQVHEMFLYPTHMRCVCAAVDGVEVAPSMSCCEQAASFNELQFGTQSMFRDIYDLQDPVTSIMIKNIENLDILDRIWTSDDFSSASDMELTPAEREQLAHMYIFNNSDSVRDYGLHETPNKLNAKTLWQTCTEMLSASFFTLPLKQDTMQVDADMIYNPADASSSDRYMHGMEEVIERILARARKDSPVFWTHSHRYVASDSVWCENTVLAVQDEGGAHTHTTANWQTQTFSDDRIRTPTAADVAYVGEVASSCVCGWTDGTTCLVPILCDDLTPSIDMQSVWSGLCATKVAADGTYTLVGGKYIYSGATTVTSPGTYTSRADLFDVMHILQTATYSMSVLATCDDLVPSVVWGLLDPREQEEWYQNTQSGTPTVDLKHLAVNGPAGLRLGLLGTSANSMAVYVREHSLNRKHPQHLPFNHGLGHTIAQPVCKKSLTNFLKADLSEHFQDVLFPMAHSVSAAPFHAYCTTWALERAIERVLLQVHDNSTDAPEKTRLLELVLQQRETVDIWRQRCDSQLKQIGICQLRGVYSMVPDGRESTTPPAHCKFTVDAAHTCATGSFYITDHCLVMCNDKFYDPCLCSTASCDTVEFKDSTCVNGILPFDPITSAQSSSTRLYSMNWPQTVRENEINTDNTATLNTLLRTLHTQQHLVTFDEADVYADMAALIASMDNPTDNPEGPAPKAHCDDLLDYFDPQAQHPVGYHPTCACSKAETNIRGFDSWMSADEAGSWAIDPVRLRNMTEYSTGFSNAHLVCDAEAYGAYTHQLNPFELNSRWDPAADADPAIPGDADPVSSTYSQWVTGTASGDQFDVPLVTDATDPMFALSTGLVRDWLSLYGSDAALETQLDAMWPLWRNDADSTPSVSVYGMDSAGVLDDCNMPELKTCVLSDTNACCEAALAAGTACQLACRSVLDTDSHGICVHKDTCFQHGHCTATGQLCSGKGTCTDPVLVVNNAMDVEVEIQMFSAATSCTLPAGGLSQQQTIPDFATAHGMCSFRDWYHYQSIVAEHAETLDAVLYTDDKSIRYTDSDHEQTFATRGTLKTYAHACDRDYQHTHLKICHDSTVHKIRSMTGPNAMTDDTPGAPPSTGMRTWHRTSDQLSVAFCNLKEQRPINGFLSPYSASSENFQTIDTLQQVSSTVARCFDFDVCPDMKFTVRGFAVLHRRVALVTLLDDSPVRHSTAFRTYRHRDADNCLAVGYLVSTSSPDDKLCVVDRSVVPLMDVVFSTVTTEHLPFTTIMRFSDDATSPWSPANTLATYNNLRSHCPRAFQKTMHSLNGVQLYREFLSVLSGVYTPDNAQHVQDFANDLLPAIFGSIDDASRGFDNLDDYLQLAACAQYVDVRLQSVVDMSKSARAYVTESVTRQHFTGDSLYVFHQRSAIPIAFTWLWQCVILTRALDGGAQTTWINILSGQDAVSQLSCPVYTERHGTSKIPLKRRLQTADDVYTLTDRVAFQSSQLAHDIDDTVAIALMQLKLPMLADTTTLEYTDRPQCQPHTVFQSNGCWEKTGISARELPSDAEYTQTDTTVPKYNLYQQMRRLIMNQHSTTSAFYAASLSDLESRNIVSVGIDMLLPVDPQAEFFPAIRFKYLDAHVLSDNDMFEEPDIASPHDTGLSFVNTYATLVSSNEYSLVEHEFRVQDNDKLSVPVLNKPSVSLSFITNALALHLLVQKFRQLIYFQASMASSNLHIDRRVSRDFMHRHETDMQTMITTAAEYDEFMSTKTYECVDDQDLNFETETNRLHTQLRQCAASQQQNVGWKLAASEQLQLHVPASVLLADHLLSFSESHQDDTFLSNLTSKDWATDTYHSMRESLCFTNNGHIQTINPYWAANFDTTIGCDTHTQDNLRLVDARCVTANAEQTCAQRFPGEAGYAAVVRNRMSPLCQQNADTLSTARRGTFRPGFTELCDLTPDRPGSCPRRHGSLGRRGESVADLEDVHGVESKQGIWHISNSIFRGHKHLPRTIVDGLSPVDVLRMLPTDIAGDSMQFTVDADGTIALLCLHLVASATAKCGSSSQHWLNRIEQHWAAQHRKQQRTWPPPVPEVLGRTVDWKCPLQWVRAYSGRQVREDVDRTYVAHTPSRERNAFRFQHITQPQSRYAHPIASSVQPALLDPGRYMSSTQCCTAEATTACQGAARLQQALTQIRSGAWTTVEHVHSTKCQRIIDWPHVASATWDHGTILGDEDTAFCNVFDRLPAFQLKESARATLRPHPAQTSVDRGGACHMGRLRRLPPEQKLKTTDVLQHCRNTPLAIECLYLDKGTSSYSTYVRSTPNTSTFSARREYRPKNTPCGQCDTHTQGKFVQRNGVRSSLADSATDQLSVGTQMRVSTARMVASHLRRLVCPSARDAGCAALTDLYASAHWANGAFLEHIFTRTSGNDNGGATASTSDDALWERNWVYCPLDPSKPNTPCKGSIAKSDWIDPTSRFRQCRNKIQESASASSATIPFCMLDANTARLCERVVEWNTQIALINCRAAGLASCQPSSDLYTPTSYSPDNHEFVHDSVKSFYASSSSATCADTARDISAQLRANNVSNLGKCASTKMVPVRDILRNGRTQARLFVELGFYAANAGLQLVGMVIASAFSGKGAPEAIAVIGKKMIMYLRLMLDTVADIMTTLYESVFFMIFGKGLGRMFKQILQFVCKMVAWLNANLVRRVVCPLLWLLSEYVGLLVQLLTSLYELDFPLIGRVLAFLEVPADLLRGIKTLIEQFVVYTCESPDLNCELDFEADVEVEETGTLPIVSRCWGTYQTFFGDSQSLACTGADTCRMSLTDSTLVMCAACPASDGVLVNHYGCDAISKQCVCNPPRLTDTRCYSNQECSQQPVSCKYVNTDLELLSSHTLCSACASSSFCYVPRGEIGGVCACGLFAVEFAQCAADKHTMLLSVPATKMCLLQTDMRFQKSISFTTRFGLAMATPCMAVDLSQAYCTRLLGPPVTYYIVAGGTAHSRRLLQYTGSDDAMLLNHTSTRSAGCRDALQDTTQSFTRQACVQLFVESSSTVLHLDLHASVPPCTFCSVEDFTHTLGMHPMLLPFLLAHPHKMWHVLQHHTILAHVKPYLTTLRQTLAAFYAVVQSTNISDIMGISVTEGRYAVVSHNPSLLSPNVAHLLQTTLNEFHALPAGNASVGPAPPLSGLDSAVPHTGRQLLTIADIARSVEMQVQRAHDTHKGYASQISSAYRYNFPDISTTETRQWLEHWPPHLGRDSPGFSTATCKPAYDAAIVLYYAVGNATLFYAANSVAPNSSLRHAFPALQDSTKSTTVFQQNVDSRNSRSDVLVRFIMWVAEGTAEWLGFRRSFFYDLFYTLSLEIKDQLVCDIEAVQTCSKWRVTLSNGIFVVGSWFFVWFLVCAAFRLQLLAALSLPLFYVMLMRLCYGYAWTCFPLIPSCLLEDVYTSIVRFFPPMILIPSTLWRSTACADAGVVDPNCLKTCQDSPFLYTSLQSVIAWILAESGSTLAKMAIDLFESVPVLDVPQLRIDVAVRAKVIDDQDVDLLTGHRLCAAIGSYRLAPYLVLLMLTLVAMAVLVQSLSTYIFSSFMIFGAVFVASFTE